MADKYIPLFELGAGAFGKAWVVKDKITSLKYVSKVIQIKGLSSKDLDRCVTEVAVLSACHHVNIVQYIQAFVATGSLNIVMEYATGGDLSQKIKKQAGTFFPKEIVVNWFLQVTMALEYIHSKNILHRDLKPQNIFLTDTGLVKLGDFGIARVLCNNEDLASTRIGTPFYISPEICEGKPYNSSSDMWAAGCLLYEMCCQQVPFTASNLDQLMELIVKADYTPIPKHFGRTIPQIVSKLMIANPVDRLSAKDILNIPEFSTVLLVLRKRIFDFHKPKRSRSLSRNRVKQYEGQRSSSANRVQAAKHLNQPHRLVSNARINQKRKNEIIGKGNIATTSKDNVYNNKELKKGPTDKACPSKGNETNIDIQKSGIKAVKGPEEGEQYYVAKHGSCDDTGRKELCPEKDSIFVAEEDGEEMDRKKRQEHTSDQSPVLRSRTYSIKDSVIRKLSAASPKLSQIITKQRFSKSITESMSSPTPVDVEEKGDNYVLLEDGHHDEVFSPCSDFEKRRIDSLTYTIHRAENLDDNSNKIHISTEDTGRALIQALSVLNNNRKLSREILFKEIAVHVGPSRAKLVIERVRQLIVTDGQSYQTLQQKLTCLELELLPLISIIIAI